MKLENKLDANEARMFGVLIEKSLTTPDQYPLSLNGATSGCNQKSNRDPVMSLTEGEVRDALARLVIHGLAGHVVPAGSRVEKYRHNGEERLGLEPTKLAILAELLMRGSQTKGELRARVNRMKPLPDAEALDAHLTPLMHAGWVQAAPPAPGSRAGRFAQTLTLESADANPVAQTGAAAPVESGSSSVTTHDTAPSNLSERVSTLEGEVAELRTALMGLAEKLGEAL